MLQHTELSQFQIVLLIASPELMIHLKLKKFKV